MRSTRRGGGGEEGAERKDVLKICDKKIGNVVLGCSEGVCGVVSSGEG